MNVLWIFLKRKRGREGEKEGERGRERGREREREGERKRRNTYNTYPKHYLI